MRSRGYTLLELLVVIAIIGVILGIGVGTFAAFGKKNELEATANAVRAIVRRARNAAREERAPATVEIDVAANEVRAMTRESLVLYRFESDQIQASGLVLGSEGGSAKDQVPEFDVKGSYSIVAHAWGAEPIEGRIGSGLLFERKGAYVRVPDRPSLSPAEGVALEAWILPAKLEDLVPKKEDESIRKSDYQKRVDDAGAPAVPTPPRALSHWARHPDEPPLFTIARKGRSFEIALTAGYALQIAVTGTGAGIGKGEATFIARTEDLAVRADKWARIQLVFDGKDAGCWIDGMRHSLVPVKGYEALPQLLARDRSPLVISDPDPERSFAGTIDEVKLQGVLRSERYQIPKNVALLAPTTEIVFDALGGLDPLRHAEPVVLWLSDAQEALVALEPPAEDPRTRPLPKAPPEDPAAKGFMDPEKARKFAALVAKLQERQKKMLTVELTGATK